MLFKASALGNIFYFVENRVDIANKVVKDFNVLYDISFRILVLGNHNNEINWNRSEN